MAEKARITSVKKCFFLIISILSLLGYPSPARSDVNSYTGVLDGDAISRNTDFHGEVVLTGDLYIPPGVTVRFVKGTVVKFNKSDSTKVEPENFLPGTEITIRGNLIAEDTRFLFQEEGGLVVDGGALSLRNSSISGANFGILLMSGTVDTAGSEIRDSLTGIMAAGCFDDGCDIKGEKLIIKQCRNGGIFPEGFEHDKLVEVRSSLEYGILTYGRHFDEEGGYSPDPVDDLKAGFAPDEVLEDLFLDRDDEWRGDILVKGVVRVSPAARLTIRAGTRVLFDFKDTNGDGIGESGLFLQGTLIVMGTDDEPVVFGSASGDGRGLWDSINFMASDREVNRIENAVIIESYRGLHSHFSDVNFKNVRIYRTYRGLQFQESKVTIEGLGVFDSVSALRCRDSDVEISGFYTAGNATGANFLRIRGSVKDVFFADNVLYGLRFRESELSFARGRITGGLYSLSLQGGIVDFAEIVQADSLFAGLRAQETELEIDDSNFQYNRIYGLSFKDGKYKLRNVRVIESGVAKMNLEGEPEVIIK